MASLISIQNQQRNDKSKNALTHLVWREVLWSFNGSCPRGGQKVEWKSQTDDVILSWSYFCNGSKLNGEWKNGSQARTYATLRATKREKKENHVKSTLTRNERKKEIAIWWFQPTKASLPSGRLVFSAAVWGQSYIMCNKYFFLSLLIIFEHLCSFSSAHFSCFMVLSYAIFFSTLSRKEEAKIAEI